MSSSAVRRPHRSEYAEYYGRYVDLVPDGDIVDVLRDQLEDSLRLLGAVPPEKADYRYAPGKWTVKEVLRHVIDIEWVFTYRGLRFARGDDTALPGVEQDALVAGTDFTSLSLRDFIEEFRHLRTANTLLFGGWAKAVLDRSGVASGCRFTARSSPYIVAGHERHHMTVLRERYL
jgi:hypothetical protein